MFDNLREEAARSPLFTGEELPDEKPPRLQGKLPRRIIIPAKILGLDARQRFYVSLMLFVTVTAAGVGFLTLNSRFVFGG